MNLRKLCLKLLMIKSTTFKLQTIASLFLTLPMQATWRGSLIRSARSILASLFNDRGKQIDDDSLHTLLTETASIINSRPL